MSNIRFHIIYIFMLISACIPEEFLPVHTHFSEIFINMLMLIIFM